MTLFNIPMYSNQEKLNEMYKQSKQRQQENIQGVILGLMLMQEKRNKENPPQN